MTKQRVVMKVSMNDEKSRTRALKTVVGVPGCLSVSIEGKENDLVVVIGEEIDCIVLVKSLRKKVGYVELITVSSVENNKKKNYWNDDHDQLQKTKQETSMMKPAMVFYNDHQQGPPLLHPVPCHDAELCSIL